MDLKKIFTVEQPEKLNWGDALGLWKICNYKVVGLAITELFVAQAGDEDLKKMFNLGIEVTVSHVEKIQKVLHKEGLAAPTVPPRKNLDVVGKQVEPNSFLQDDELAMSILEIYKHGLVMEMNALANATRDDIRDLIWEILSQDYRGFDAMIKELRKKNWLIVPQTV